MLAPLKDTEALGGRRSWECTRSYTIEHEFVQKSLTGVETVGVGSNLHSDWGTTYQSNTSHSIPPPHNVRGRIKYLGKHSVAPGSLALVDKPNAKYRHSSLSLPLNLHHYSAYHGGFS